MNMLEKVTEIIAQELGCQSNALSTDSGLGQTDGWDSLAHSQIVLALEEKLDVSFDFDELDKIICVQEIMESLKQKGSNNEFR